MTDDAVDCLAIPTLRNFAERCRQLALVARHAAMQAQLLQVADEMEQQAELYEREGAPETDR